jgi:uncharacterized protein (DUF924 family)
MLLSRRREPYHNKPLTGRSAVADIITEIHDFWFGELDENGLCAKERNALWFGASAETDTFCRARFAASLTLALRGELDHWAQTDRGLIALVVLLDQFSRNIHRGTPQAFASDPQALALAQDAIATGRHLRLPAIHRIFLYLPLQHCEIQAVQEQSVALNEDLARLIGNPEFANFARYAVAHRDIIAQFGRFPHRNAILGRASTKAELTYLAEHGGF